MAKRQQSEAPLSYPRDSEFHLGFENRAYHKQYFKLYSQRLERLRPRVFKLANKRWDHKKIQGIQVHHCDKVLDIPSNKPCWIIGLTYCEMQYKPNILDDVSIGAYGTIPPPKPSYSDPDSDVLMLEDESGRVQLDGDLIKNSIFVTGNVIGILGIEVEAGSFKVLDILYPEIAPQVQRPLINKGNKIAIISGLEIDGSNYDVVKLELLKEFLTGELGEGSDQLDTLTSQITRLIIAGNSTNSVGNLYENNGGKHFGTAVKTHYNAGSMKILDQWLSEVLSSLPVDILPGESDPAEAIFPQQPLHSAFFKESKKYLNSACFRSLTNPSWLDIDGTRLLATGGQNINDMYKYVVPYYGPSEKPELRINLIEATLNWQNIVPSCPDTLWTHPFQDSDPFTLDETPHVYFVGNQPKFETKLVELGDVKIRVISVPKFSSTGKVVILDLETLEPTCLQIG